MNQKQTLILILLIAIIGISLLTVFKPKKSELLNSQNQTTQTESSTELTTLNEETSSQTKLISTNNYSFQAPSSWIESRTGGDDCEWLTIANDSSDGMRMAGEVGIYPASCFDMKSARGYNEFTELSGYYIVKYSDPETGTTETEVTETAEAYQLVLDTFLPK